MADPSSPARRHTKVALRTLRQLPKIVGETCDGDPIVEVRSVRLLLRPNASYFNRIVACSKCGVEVAGSPVRHPHDLNKIPNPLICKACVASVGNMYGTEFASTPAAAKVIERSRSDDDPHEREPATEERLAPLEERIADLSDLLDARITAGETSVDERLEVTRAELAALSAGAGELARAQQDVDEKLNAVIERLDRSPDIDGGRLDALEGRMEEAVTGLTPPLEAQPSGITTALEARLGQLQTALEGDLAQVRGAVAQLGLGNQDLGRMQRETERRLESVSEGVAEAAESSRYGLKAVDALERRVDEAVESLTARLDRRVQQLQAGLDAQAAGAGPTSAMAERATEELARIEAQLNERFERWTERAALNADLGDRRLRALEVQVQEGAVRLAETVESQRVELQTELRKTLIEVQATITDTAARGDSRLQALEARVQNSDTEVSELGLLQAALDAGLGELRSGIGAVRDAAEGLAGRQRELDARLDAVAPAKTSPHADHRWGRRSGRSSEGGTAHLDAVTTATAELVLEQKELQDRLDRLEQVANTATAAAARASSQIAALGPLGRDLGALKEQLAAQDEALASLSRTVGRLRPRPPAQAPTKRAAKRTTG